MAIVSTGGRPVSPRRDAWHLPRAWLQAVILVAAAHVDALHAQVHDIQTAVTREQWRGGAEHRPGEAPSVSSASFSLALANRLYSNGQWQEIVRRYESHDPREAQQAELLLLVAKSLQHLERIDEAAVIYDMVDQVAVPKAGSFGYLSSQRARSTALLNLASLRLAQARSALRRFTEHRMPHEAVNRLESGSAEIDAQLRQSKAQSLAQQQQEQQQEQDQQKKRQQPSRSDRLEPANPAVVIEYRQGSPGEDGR